MIQLEEKYNILSASDSYISEKHERDKLIVFEKGNLLFVFNFHPTEVYYII